LKQQDTIILKLQENKADENVNFEPYFFYLKSKSKSIISISIFIIFLSVMYAFFATPLYRAQVTMVSANENANKGINAVLGRFGGIASLAGVNFGALDQNVEETLAILMSRAFLGKFILQNNLLPVLFDKLWDVENNKWLVDDDEDIPSLWDAYKLVTKRILKIDMDSKTGIVVLTLDWKDPEQAALWANMLIAELNNYVRGKAILESEKRIKYLNDQITKTNIVEIRQAIYGLIEAQNKTSMVANTREEYAFKIIDQAVVPEQRESPKRLKVIILGIILSFFVSITVIMLVGSLKREIHL